MPGSTCGNDVVANGLFTEMTTGVDFSIPSVDLTHAQFTIPDTTNNPLFDDVTRLSEGDLTSRTVGGAGVFDALMESIKNHLAEEFEKNRLSGKEYATTYVQLTQSALATSTQFLLNREQSFYSAQLVQKQAQLAEIEAVRGRVILEAEKARFERERMDANTAAANYALTKLRLATEDATTCQVKAQTTQTEYQTDNLLPAQLGQLQKQTEIANYELTNILPKEALRIQSQVDTADADISRITAQTNQTLYETSALLPAQKLNVEAETDVKNYQLTAMLPAQLAQLTKQTAVTDYELTYVLPKDVERLQSQIDTSSAQISHITAQKDQVLFQTASILPAQKLNVEADTDLKGYQLTAVLPAQVAGLNKDTEVKDYNLSFVLPTQKLNLTEQAEANRAKTMDTRIDGITQIAGSIGKQKELYSQQIASYQHDAQNKTVKMLMDSWITGKSIDEAWPTPNNLTNANIDTAFDTLRTNVGL